MDKYDSVTDMPEEETKHVQVQYITKARCGQESLSLHHYGNKEDKATPPPRPITAFVAIAATLTW